MEAFKVLAGPHACLVACIHLGASLLVQTWPRTKVYVGHWPLLVRNYVIFDDVLQNFFPCACIM